MQVSCNLLEPIGYISPSPAEANYSLRLNEQSMLVRLRSTGLYETWAIHRTSQPSSLMLFVLLLR